MTVALPGGDRSGGVTPLRRQCPLAPFPPAINPLNHTVAAVEQLRPLAEKAFTIQRILRVNPRPVTVDDLENILRAAL
jgi:hypothetical protein